MGTDYAHAFAADGEGPVRPVTVSPFRMDTFPVTNKDFAAFVEETGYKTESEIFAWSFVFWMHLPADRLDELVEDTVAAAPWWCKVPGADWRHPEGPGSHVDDRQDHPVVHVSWNDAAAYAAWAGRSLVTEAQWEYAARGGLEQKLYPWGDDLTPGGKHRCNIWQGEFPRVDTAEDGFAGACAVDSFPPNGFGLYSMTGNVWEWCADWFQKAFNAQPRHDPAGPEHGRVEGDEGWFVSLPCFLLQSLSRGRAYFQHTRQRRVEHRFSLCRQIISIRNIFLLAPRNCRGTRMRKRVIHP